MKNKLTAVLIIFGVFVVIGLVLSYQAFLWEECRTVGHSWLYCLKFITK